MYLKDGAKARNIPCFRWCDQEIVWRSRSQQLKSTNYYMTTTPMSLQRFSLSASALLLSWVKPWPIQTTPASIGSMMMPYGAWTSNVVWSGTVWGTPVNHHLPSKPGNLEQVEAWCVLLSLCFVCLVQELLRFVWFCIVFLPFGSQGACCPAKYSFHHITGSKIQLWTMSGMKVSATWPGATTAKNNQSKSWTPSISNISEFEWLEWKRPQRAFLLSFPFRHGWHMQNAATLAAEIREVAVTRQGSCQCGFVVFKKIIFQALAPYLHPGLLRHLLRASVESCDSNRLMWVKSHCSPILFRGRHCPEESRGQGVFTTRSVWGYKIPKFFPHKSAFEDFPSYIEFEDFPHLDRSLRSGELLVAFGGLGRVCHRMGRCQDLQCKVRAIGCSTRGAPKICGFRESWHFLCVTLLARSIRLLMEIWHDGCHLSIFIGIYPIIYSILS